MDTRRTLRWSVLSLVALCVVPAAHLFLTVCGTHHHEVQIDSELRELGADVTMFYSGPDWIPQGVCGRLSIFDRIAMVHFNCSPAIDDHALETLTGLEHLYYLDLHGTRVGDDGLRFLGSLRGLQQLNLSETEITDSGLEHLKGLVNLEIVFVESTKVTERGRKGLRTALPNCYVHPHDQ